MKSLIVFSGILAVCLGQGPTQPINGAVCDAEGNKAVDANNMCWYHECTLNDQGNLGFLARRCALGSKVSYNFVQGFHNPCTINFDDVIGYDCDRTQLSVDGPPPCHDINVRLNCQNGGTATYEADKCWCLCSPSWLGHFDCSIPTQDTSNLDPGSDICVDGQPGDDWCALAGGCLNGGTCFNQCDTFWCDCPDHETVDYYGKRCENPPRAN